MLIRELFEDGRIVNGVNTTVDVGIDQISIEAAKLGFNVSKDGVPPLLGEAHHMKNPKNTFLAKADTAYDFLRVGKTISNLDNVKKDANRDEPDVMIVPFGGKKEKDHLKKGLKKAGYKTQDADKDGDDAHVDEAVGQDCPPATQDLELNTKNRDATLKNFNYGPLNVSEPGDYWEKIAKYWKTDVKAALASNCGNCVAFDISPRMDDCMPGETSDKDGRLGYCWMHHFKCHSARSCHTWAKGGPIIDDEKSLDWQKRGEDKVKENFVDSKKKVQEAFNNPYPITWEYLNPTGASSGIVKLDDGSALDIHFSEEPAGVYEIEFARDGSNKQMGRSGQGDEFRVFATVQAAISKWWGQLDKTSAEQITFYANTQDGNRARLYKRFLQMWAKKSKWDIKSNDRGGIMSYTLNKPKKSGAGSIFKRLGFGKKETVENFADGKVKGKSRPGRVKRAGASCNGTVTQLRKRAKNASGEKAKMYHWCANMKGGKK